MKSLPILALTTGITVILMSGCSHHIILLSPEDHYFLGNHYLDKGENAKAKEQFEYIRDHYTLSEFGTMSQFKLAQTQFLRKNYLEAAVDFEIFLEFHPAHKLASYAQYHLALSKFHSIRTPDRDQTMTREALSAFNKFLQLYPDHPNFDNALSFKHRVEDHLFKHDLAVARTYYRRHAFDSTINRLEQIPQLAHEQLLRAESSYLLGRSYEQLNDKERALEYYRSVSGVSRWVEKARNRMKNLD
ncbi:outer membrane protein assembly factor BamD [bacterium]|nr:outer membrane protein assembly factor BamD [candidate division CSSED10-310 bacterium]